MQLCQVFAVVDTRLPRRRRWYAERSAPGSSARERQRWKAGTRRNGVRRRRVNATERHRRGQKTASRFSAYISGVFDRESYLKINAEFRNR